MVVYDFKTHKSELGVVKQVLGNNTYSVDCSSKGLQHISGDALSTSTLTFEKEEGRSRLTAQENAQEVQDDLQEESHIRVESDSDSSDDELYQDMGVVPVIAPRRRRIRQLGLGPTVPNRLRQRN